MEKRVGFFEQQLGTVFLTFKFFADVLLAFLSGMFCEHDKDNKSTPVITNKRFRNSIEFII
jgi:hypothetical protein